MAPQARLFQRTTLSLLLLLLLCISFVATQVQENGEEDDNKKSTTRWGQSRNNNTSSAPDKVNGEDCRNGICRDKRDNRYLTSSGSSQPQYTVCQDFRTRCPEWAASNFCYKEARYMHPHCPKTCHTCHNRTQKVPIQHAFSPRVRNPKKKPILNVVGQDIGVAQEVEMANTNTTTNNRVVRNVAAAREYLLETVMKQERYRLVRETCRNKHRECSLWAAHGECSNNANFMRVQCAPVCFSCEELHVEAKCPLDPNAVTAWKPGDLNRMFERIITTTDTGFQPTVLSRPEYAGNDTKETANYILGPWVVVLDDFLSAEEAKRLVEVGSDMGYAPSSEVGQEYHDGTLEEKFSAGRTSENTWCNKDVCLQDPLVQAVQGRIESLTGIPQNHSEPLQLLRYQKGQYYRSHHDYIEEERYRVEGPRILTVFLYLNDVEQGGGTYFNQLDVTVQPIRGRALLWPSVLDQDPTRVDMRTYHEALPVEHGEKYAANSWQHQRSIAKATEMGCYP